MKTTPPSLSSLSELWLDIDDVAMKTSVDSMACWLALLYIIASLFGLYPPITKLPVGGSFDLHIQQQFENSGHQRFQLEEPLRYNRFEWGRRFVPNASLSLVPSLSPSGNPGPNPSQMLSLNPFNPWDSSSSTQLLWDNDDDGDEDKECRDNDNAKDDDDDNDDDDDDLIYVDDDNNLMHLQNFDLNDIEEMSEYKVLHLRRIRRNEAKLVSLGLLAPMTSTTSLSSDRSKNKKRSAPQDDVERRVQPTRNAKKMTSYRDLDDHVIFKRTQPIDFSDIGEENIVRKRICEDVAESSPSRGDDEEEYDRDEDERRAVSSTHTFCRCLCFQHLVLNSSTPANVDCLHLNDRQYQSIEFYKAKKRLIDRYEEVSGGIKAKISPDPLPLPQEMKKQKNNYEGSSQDAKVDP